MNIQPYLDFINECKLKNDNNDLINYHEHHILPKFMGGTNNKSNLIKLSYSDHFNAHIILANCFDKNSYQYRGNMYSAKLINQWLKYDISNWKISSGMLNKNHSSITKNKISKSMKSFWLTYDSIDRDFKISKKLKGRIFTEEHKENIKLKHADFNGINNPMYNKSHKEKSIINISKKMKGNTNSPKGPRNSFIFYKDGVLIEEVFGQIGAKNFCKKNNISYQTICKDKDTWQNWKCKRKRKYE